MSRSLKLFITVLLSVTTWVAAGPAKAQTAQSAPSGARTNTMLPAYDVTKEVKIQGTIQKIDGFGVSGPVGTHILLETSAGVVDAHLGFGAASNPKYLGIAPGQSVTVTGMMGTIGTTNVLMARILTTPNHIFVLRNEHGIPVRAIPRGSMPRKSFSSGFDRLGGQARGNPETAFSSGFTSTNPETLFSSGFRSRTPETWGGV